MHTLVGHVEIFRRYRQNKGSRVGALTLIAAADSASSFCELFNLMLTDSAASGLRRTASEHPESPRTHDVGIEPHIVFVRRRDHGHSVMEISNERIGSRR